MMAQSALFASAQPIAAYEIPVKMVSEANRHEHFRYRQMRARQQRAAAKLATSAALSGLTVGLPLLVVITRVSPRGLDSDNLQGSAKHVRDGIADVLGVDDRDERVIWRVRQERGPAKVYAAKVTISRANLSAHYCERCAAEIESR